jgi:NitT/TauT family transport system ATP-binding protein
MGELASSGEVTLAGVSMDFATRFGPRRVLDGIDLTVTPGEFVCLVGASGSGKSTLLSLVAGLQAPTEGRITLDGELVEGPAPQRGLVFQTGSLFPWRTVERNVAFGLELLPLPSSDRDGRVADVLAEVGLTGLRAALPKQLSGGERQRVAIARALVCEPEVLLLDEPFGALDVQTKEDMQVFLRGVWRREGTTVVMVTHDVEEAVFLAQRVLVLGSHPGRIVAERPIDLPVERDLAVKRTREFLTLRAEIEDLVRGQRVG